VPSARPGGAADESTAADRRLAAAAVTTVRDALLQLFWSPTGETRGLRGGKAAARFVEPGAVVTLDKARFAADLAVSGKATVTFAPRRCGDFGYDATIQVNGPGRQDGRLELSTCHTFETDATTTVTGRIDGRTLRVSAPAY
jgi:hypothetical protein